MGHRYLPLILCFALAFAAASGGVSTAARADVLIGVNEAAPVHVHVARALCRTIGPTLGEGRCQVQRIGGGHAAAPIAVLSDVRNNTIEIGLTQSDWVHHAFGGTGPVEFMDVRFENLRTLFVLHGEPFTVVARRDAGIGGLDDLVGKRVNIGVPGSNQRLVMQQVMAAKGWTRDSFQLADELTGPEQSLALCHNRIQAMVVTVAHPDPAIGKTLQLCDAEIVPIGGAAVDDLIEEKPYFAFATIPAATYEGQTAAVQTFGVRVVAVVSEDMSEADAYGIVEAVVQNLDTIKRLHPALGGVRAKAMTRGGISAPIHAGVAKYFREKGIM
ncbi:MAG: TAXI family TRAP transporter solute-binding subunit [Alphaproteobacteria bacterium]|jgi:hypothetical protein|nr:TAXI family TRAP transporter solute-binding subunit [Alphaproteobacteria bacterium]